MKKDSIQKYSSPDVDCSNCKGTGKVLIDNISVPCSCLFYRKADLEKYFRNYFGRKLKQYVHNLRIAQQQLQKEIL